MTISSSCLVLCSMILYNTGLACDKFHCKPIPDSAYCVRSPSTAAQLAGSRPTAGLCGPLLEYATLARMGAAPTHLHQLDRVQRRALHIIGPDTILQSLASGRHVAGLSFLYKLLCMSGPDQLTAMVRPLQPPPGPARPRLNHIVQARHAFQLSEKLPATVPNFVRRAFHTA